MTATRFVIAKILSTFGLTFSERYRTSAAFEAHLLRDAESVIGSLTWEKVEGIEELSNEYWKLRKLAQKHDRLSEEMARLSAVLESSQEARNQMIEVIAEPTSGPAGEREQLASKIAQLQKEREEIQRDGRAIKRSHEGFKTKLEVLVGEQNEHNQSTIDSTNAQLKELREKFGVIKKRRDEIDSQKELLEKELSLLNEKISEDTLATRREAESQFSTIGKTNKELTSLKSEAGSIEGECEQLFSHIGNYLLTSQNDPEVQAATKDYRGLISTVKAIRASSNRHRKLFDN